MMFKSTPNELKSRFLERVEHPKPQSASMNARRRYRLNNSDSCEIAKYVVNCERKESFMRSYKIALSPGLFRTQPRPTKTNLEYSVGTNDICKFNVVKNVVVVDTTDFAPGT